MAAATEKKEPRGLPIPAIVGLSAVMALGGALYWLQQPSAPSQGPGPASADVKAYSRSLKLSDVDMKATDSYLGQRVVEIVGRIQNAGDRTVKQVDLTCIFYDPYNQQVLRERTTIVRPRGGPFAPGDTREFRLPFDNIPSGWNQSMPQMVIAGIVFD